MRALMRMEQQKLDKRGLLCQELMLKRTIACGRGLKAKQEG